jgi:2-octaprenyl-6-methoxyphenol hydroxylase
MTAAHILIRGAGPIGLACALFLVRRGVPARQIRLDPDLHQAGEIPPHLAQRVLAVSEGSCQLLERVIELPLSGRIRRVEVSLLGHLGRTRIDAADLKVAALGRVLRYGDLLAALRQQATLLQWADPIDPPHSECITVHAEGDAGDDASVRDFDQAALLGEVHAPQAPSALHDVAFERFTAHGPLALLPLARPGYWSMVWCDRVDTSRERQGADRAQLEAALHDRIGPRLGPLQLQGPLGCAPLSRRTRRIVHQSDQVWIGNAAQSLHPVAGQGLNLGLRDAFELADALAHADRLGTSARHALQAWGTRRHADRLATVRLTDLMASSFTWPLARPLQSAALGLLDIAAPLRRPLASRLMFGQRS